MKGIKFFLELIISIALIVPTPNALQSVLQRRQILQSIPSIITSTITDSSSCNDAYNDVNDDIYFYGPVTQESCFWLTQAINQINKEINEETTHVGRHINLHIQSEGGELVPTFHVIDTIKRSRIPIYTYIDGFAASAATLISIVGHQRFMEPHSLMLLHQLSGRNEGTFQYMQEEMTTMNTYMNFVKEIYVSHSKISYTEIDKILEIDNRWLNASTCLEYGLVDEIII